MTPLSPTPQPDWTTAGYLLETTFTKCLCGSNSRHNTFSKVQVCRVVQRGRPAIARRIIPLDATSTVSPTLDIEQLTVHRSIPVCNACLHKKINSKKVRPIDEAEWLQTLARKAHEAREPKPAAKPPKKKTFSLYDFMKELDQ